MSATPAVAAPRPEADVPRALRWATTAVALIGAGMYGMSEAVRATGNPLALLGVVVLAFVPWLGKRHPLTVRSGTVLSLGIILLASIDWWLFTNDAALAVGRIVLGLQMVRLWSPLGTRERLQVFLLSLTHCAAAAVLTVDILFAVFFVAYAVVATWALALHFLDHEARLCGAPPPRTTARFLAGISILSVLTIAFTAAIFLVVPRVGAGLLQTDLAANQVRVAGFSDQVRIGDIGEILRGDDEVMRVEFVDAGEAEDPMQQLRMRGRVFEWCRRGEDNRYHWRVPTVGESSSVAPGGRTATEKPARSLESVGYENGTREAQPRLFKRMETTVARYSRGKLPQEPVLLRQSVTLEPMASAALFFAGPPESLLFQQGWKHPAQFRTDPGGTVVEWSLGARATGEVKYMSDVWLDPGTRKAAHYPGPALAPPEKSLRGGSFDVSECLNRPEGMPDALWERLATQATAWAGDAADAGDPWQVADEIQLQLRDRGGYAYSLDMPDPAGADPLEFFLFEKKEGHCEYYAMSMVMLMRAAGHEARLVTGFVGGEVNPVGGYRLIRQSDAHAWVEVLSADRKWWKAFDPTPRSDLAPGRLAIIGQLFDWMKFRWYSGVVDYDIHDQRRALIGGARSARTWTESIKEWFRDSMTGTRGLRGLGGLAIVLVGLYLLFVRRRPVWLGGAPAGAPTISFYAELLRLLERRGVRRLPGQTPREFAAVAGAERGVPSGPIDMLTDLFCRSRYGGGALDEADRSRAKSALESIRAALTTPQ